MTSLPTSSTHQLHRGDASALADASSSHPPAAEASETSWRLPLENYRLDNGLEIVLQPDPRSPVTVVHLALRTGSASDPEGRSGLAHLAEHLVYRGLGKGQLRTLPRLIESRGGIPGAYTTHDRCHFFETLPAGQLQTGLWVEAERLHCASAEVPKTLLNQEKAVLLQERLQQVESPPYGRLYETLHQELYPLGHPYHSSPMGSREGLEAVTESDLSQFFLRSLEPSNAVLVVAGDFVTEEVRGQIEELFSSRESSQSRNAHPDDSGGESREWCDPTKGFEASALGGSLRLREPVPFARSLVAFPVAGECQEEFQKAAILARLLAGSPSSPLVQTLAQPGGPAQEISSGLVEMRFASTLVVDAVGHPGVSSRVLETAILDAVEDFLKTPIPAPLWLGCQKAAQRELAEEIDHLGRRAEGLARFALAGLDPLVYGAELQRRASTSSRELRDYARNNCGPHQRLLVSVDPLGGHS